MGSASCQSFFPCPAHCHAGGVFAETGLEGALCEDTPYRLAVREVPVRPARSTPSQSGSPIRRLSGLMMPHCA
jgi:hypothetical protein